MTEERSEPETTAMTPGQNYRERCWAVLAKADDPERGVEKGQWIHFGPCWRSKKEDAYSEPGVSIYLDPVYVSLTGVTPFDVLHHPETYSVIPLVECGSECHGSESPP